jgi:plastocyanin
MSRTTIRSSALAVLVALAVTAMLAVTAGTAGAAAKVQTLTLSAKPHMLAFSTKRLSAHAGTIRIIMVNPKNSGIAHAIAVSGNGVSRSGKVVAPGHDSIVTVTLKKGSYTFYCPVPGHEMAGMKGTLTVS